jgi:hypothetical protein
MPRARLLIAGVTAIAVIAAADASAQDCPDWLRWACPDGAPPSTAAVPDAQPGQAEQQPRRTTSPTGQKAKQARPAAVPANPSPQQTRIPEPARSTAGQQARSSDPAGDRRPPRQGERRGARPAMDDQEKEALFQKFLEWQKEHRPNAETRR